MTDRQTAAHPDADRGAAAVLAGPPRASWPATVTEPPLAIVIVPLAPDVAAIAMSPPTLTAPLSITFSVPVPISPT